MAQPMTQQHIMMGIYVPPIPYYDILFDGFAILKGDTLAKYYLREFDQQTNTVMWTKNVNRAKIFSAREDAEKVGNQLGRPYDIEEQDVFI